MKTTKIYYGGLRGVKRAVKVAMNILFTWVGIYLLSGCAASYYAPAAQNVPLFQEKKEANISGDFRIGNDTKGFDIQTAVAATDHLGITVNYSHYTGDEENYNWYSGDISSVTYGSSTFEMGLGYYLPFKDKMVFEIYSGYATSNFKTNGLVHLSSGIQQVHSNSFFIQPDIGLRIKHFEVAFSSRIRVNSYNKVSYAFGFENNEYDYTDDLMRSHPVVCFMEPAVTLRVGGEHVKFQIQGGPSFIISKDQYFSHDPLNLNFGLIVRLGGDKKAEPVK
jgi:hypothetical protein